MWYYHGRSGSIESALSLVVVASASATEVAASESLVPIPASPEVLPPSVVATKRAESAAILRPLPIVVLHGGNRMNGKKQDSPGNRG